MSGLVSYGIGQAFGGAGDFGHELMRAVTHGYANGVISGATGGDFGQGFASGFLSSAGGSAFQAIAGPKIASNFLATVGFSALSGGVGAELTGGDFWKGASIGAMVGALNHMADHINNGPKYPQKRKKTEDIDIKETEQIRKAVGNNKVVQKVEQETYDDHGYIHIALEVLNNLGYKFAGSISDGLDYLKYYVDYVMPIVNSSLMTEYQNNGIIIVKDASGRTYVSKNGKIIQSYGSK